MPPNQIPTPLEWAIAEKHAAEADAEREKNTADTLRLRVAELENALRVERESCAKIVERLTHAPPKA